MKTLYIYTDGNNPEKSDALRQAAQAIDPLFVELRLDTDYRKHTTNYAGIEAVIDVDGTVIEVQEPTKLSTIWQATADIAVVVTPIEPTSYETLLALQDAANAALLTAAENVATATAALRNFKGKL